MIRADLPLELRARERPIRGDAGDRPRRAGLHVRDRPVDATVTHEGQLASVDDWAVDAGGADVVGIIDVAVAQGRARARRPEDDDGLARDLLVHDAHL